MCNVPPGLQMYICSYKTFVTFQVYSPCESGDNNNNNRKRFGSKNTLSGDYVRLVHQEAYFAKVIKHHALCLRI